MNPLFYNSEERPKAHLELAKRKEEVQLHPLKSSSATGMIGSFVGREEKEITNLDKTQRAIAKKLITKKKKQKKQLPLKDDRDYASSSRLPAVEDKPIVGVVKAGPDVEAKEAEESVVKVAKAKPDVESKEEGESVVKVVETSPDVEAKEGEESIVKVAKANPDVEAKEEGEAVVKVVEASPVGDVKEEEKPVVGGVKTASAVKKKRAKPIMKKVVKSPPLNEKKAAGIEKSRLFQNKKNLKKQAKRKSIIKRLGNRISENPLYRALFGRPFGKQFIPGRLFIIHRVDRYDPHNSFIAILYRTGCIGFLMFMLIAIRELKKSYSLAKKTQWTEQKLMLVGCMVCFIYHVGHSVLDVTLENPFKGGIYWLLLGLMMALRHMTPSSGENVAV